jgi:hypothetical protein
VQKNSEASGKFERVKGDGVNHPAFRRYPTKGIIPLEVPDDHEAKDLVVQ